MGVTTKAPAAYGGTGFTNPTYAYAQDTSYATSAADAQWETYSNYGFALNASATISLVRINVRGFCATNDKIKVELSTNGGSSWLATSSTPTLTTGNADHWVDATSWTTWTPASFNGNAIFARVTHVKTGGADTVSLDYLPVEVTWSVATVVTPGLVSLTATLYAPGVSTAGGSLNAFDGSAFQQDAFQTGLGGPITPDTLALTTTLNAPSLKTSFIVPVKALTASRKIPVLGWKFITGVKALTTSRKNAVYGFGVVPILLEAELTPYAPDITNGAMSIVVTTGVASIETHPAAVELEFVIRLAAPHALVITRYVPVIPTITVPIPLTAVLTSTLGPVLNWNYPVDPESLTLATFIPSIGTGGGIGQTLYLISRTSPYRYLIVRTAKA